LVRVACLASRLKQSVTWISVHFVHSSSKLSKGTLNSGTREALVRVFVIVMALLEPVDYEMGGAASYRRYVKPSGISSWSSYLLPDQQIPRWRDAEEGHERGMCLASYNFFFKKAIDVT